HRQAAPATKAVADSVAAQMARVSAPVAPAPLAPAPAMVASAPASAQNAEKPSDFAFVEPKYSVKDDDKDNVSAAPVVKAQEAASRFADKTAAELVATNSNAAMAQAAGSSQGIQPAVNLA